MSRIWLTELEAALWGPLPDGSDEILSRWRCHDQNVYLGTPINSGPGLVRHLRAERDATPRAVPRKQILHTPAPVAVVRDNTSDLPVIRMRISQAYPTATLIDSTSFDVPGWTQGDYYRVCTELVARFTFAAVFGPGWHLSRGCQVELVAALTHDVPTFDARMEPLTASTVRARLSDAIGDFEGVGIDTSLTNLCIEAIENVGAPARPGPGPVTAGILHE